MFAMKELTTELYTEFTPEMIKEFEGINFEHYRDEAAKLYQNGIYIKLHHDGKRPYVMKVRGPNKGDAWVEYNKDGYHFRFLVDKYMLKMNEGRNAFKNAGVAEGSPPNVYYYKQPVSA